MVQFTTLAGLGLLAAAPVFAHPGADAAHEALERRAFYNSQPVAKRSLDHCAAKLKARGLDAASLARRAVSELPASAPLKKRGQSDLQAYTYSHNYTSPNVTLNTPASDLFTNASSNATETSCLLVPEAIAGPYYVTGENIRRNLTETERGVPLTLALQFIDVSTCEPVPDMYIDIWNANSTGVYSGTAVSGNGNVNDTANINTTALRGVAMTDHDGTTVFDTIVPGHYSGRANHIHILSHINTTTYLNNTISYGNVSHVGQVYFDQDLLDEVEATYPYNTNTIKWTQNYEDVLILIESDTPGIDPYLKYAYVGDNITDGLIAWKSIGIDVHANYTASVGAGGSRYATGGVTDSGDLSKQEAGIESTLLEYDQTTILSYATFNERGMPTTLATSAFPTAA